jgi:hypothetical protein
MRPQERIITRLPLEQLWDDSGNLAATRVRDLSRAEIRDLLTLLPVQFVVANVGKNLRWIAIEQRFEVWKRDVQIHLADDRDRLEEYPGGLAYTASEWRRPGNEVPIVLLEMHH